MTPVQTITAVQPQSIAQCRVCNSTKLKLLLDLGSTPLANALLTTEQMASSEFVELQVPLGIVLCEACALVQITHLVPPAMLFSNYAYFSSFSDTMIDHAKTLVEKLVRERKLSEAGLALEIGSNDGYLLQFYKERNIPVLGIEPAGNIILAARQKGIESICEFFSIELAKDLQQRGCRADIIHAHNVLAHVPDLNGFFAGIGMLLSATGIAVVEVPYLPDMIDRVEFDTIYHEHIFYFSLTALQNICQRNGLKIVDVERLPIHGGSLRLFIGKQETVGASVIALLAQEEERCLNRYTAYQDFAQRVARLKQEVRQFLNRLKEQGKTIAAYGAAAKGSTFLNYMNIGKETIDFVVDRSTVKQGRYMPGVHIPILPPIELQKQQPDYVLLLTWNFAEEIFKQQQSYIDNGGKFIVPGPSPYIVDKSSLASR